MLCRCMIADPFINYRRVAMKKKIASSFAAFLLSITFAGIVLACAFVNSNGCLVDVERNGGVFGWGGETTVTYQCQSGTSEYTYSGNQEEELCTMLQEQG